MDKIITAANGNAFLASSIFHVFAERRMDMGPRTIVRFRNSDPEVVSLPTMGEAIAERDRIIGEWHAWMGSSAEAKP